MGLRALLGAFVVGLILFGSGAAYADKMNVPTAAEAAAVVLSNTPEDAAPAQGADRYESFDSLDRALDGIDDPGAEEVCTVLMVLRGQGLSAPPVSAGRHGKGPHISERPPVPPPERGSVSIQAPTNCPHLVAEFSIPCQSGEPDSEVCTILMVWRGAAIARPLNLGPLAQAPYPSTGPPVPPPEPSRTITAALFSAYVGAPITGGVAGRDSGYVSQAAANLDITFIHELGFHERAPFAPRGRLDVIAHEQCVAARGPASAGPQLGNDLLINQGNLGLALCGGLSRSQCEAFVQLLACVV